MFWMVGMGEIRWLHFVCGAGGRCGWTGKPVDELCRVTAAGCRDPAGEFSIDDEFISRVTWAWRVGCHKRMHLLTDSRAS